ncbi:thioesterase family protein [Nibribacter koreensis]|uniref:Acyl-CoA thioester hydrolase n=1 Tax=Nibribacter koreensis TaxID=1084519 RepID=A0ABP8FBK9_9BACT
MNNEYLGHVIWSQVDANMHLRHSAYADFGAQARIVLPNELGLDFSVFQKLQMGPILFREELTYQREVGINDNIRILSFLTKAKPDGSRWSIRHDLYRGDGVKAAVINVDGAWLDLRHRKLTGLPPEVAAKFMEVAKSEDFEQIGS